MKTLLLATILLVSNSAFGEENRPNWLPLGASDKCIKYGLDSAQQEDKDVIKTMLKMFCGLETIISTTKINCASRTFALENFALIDPKSGDYGPPVALPTNYRGVPPGSKFDNYIISMCAVYLK